MCLYLEYTFGTVIINQLMSIIFLCEKLGIPEYIGNVFPSISIVSLDKKKRAVAAYISAAQRIGWELAVGHLSPVVTTEGGGVLGPSPQPV